VIGFRTKLNSEFCYEVSKIEYTMKWLNMSYESSKTKVIRIEER
jgi:hypothetical protein